MDQQVETVSRWVDTLIEFAVTYGFQIFGALVFLVIGLKVAAWAGGRIAKSLGAKDIDQTLARFLGNMVKIIMVALLVIITLGNFGISIAPLIALAGASAFGATLAIQGPLSNYGAGLSIILSRIFVIGNTITINRDVTGVVENITLANTILLGEDGERITIPNKEIVGRVLVNSHENRVVQSRLCISESEDWELALDVLRTALADVDDLKDAPKPQVGVHDFTFGGVIIGLRFWVPSKRYYHVRYRANEAALKALKEAGIRLHSASHLAVAAPRLSADEAEDDSGAD
ncbi:MAG: mechanosensitive ion channel family protein [Rhodospirillales bacterium]|nr:mechanosensitive ion channel family protein [Rhodospirillales bacterium]